VDIKTEQNSYELGNISETKNKRKGNKDLNG
jgi:hypothetical protein